MAKVQQIVRQEESNDIATDQGSTDDVNADERDKNKDDAAPEADVEECRDREATLYMTNAQFTMAKLFDTMLTNNGSCLLLYDEIPALYEQIEHNQGGAQTDRKIFLSLNGADTWSRATKKGGTITIEKTHFNYSGKFMITRRYFKTSMVIQRKTLGKKKD